MEASADPRAVNDQGKRPDEVAAEEGWEEIAQWLRHDPLALAGDIPESSTGREGSRRRPSLEAPMPSLDALTCVRSSTCGLLWAIA